MAELAGRIAGDVLGQSAEVAGAARRAAALCKADLATDMVGEFPELQGVMGGVYAREQGEPEAVWKAIYHHYLPIGVGAEDPPSREALGEAAVTWAAVALADKVDTVVGSVRRRGEADRLARSHWASAVRRKGCCGSCSTFPS